MVNTDTHKRFWVTLTNSDFKALEEDAKKKNLSVSANASQIIGEYLYKDKTDGLLMMPKSPSELNSIIVESLKKQKRDVMFTVRDMFDDTTWKSLSRSEKAVAAKILASIERNMRELEIGGIQNKTNLYVLKEESV